MGKQNRQRRAAARRQRAGRTTHARTGRRPGGSIHDVGGPGRFGAAPPPPSVDELVTLVAHALRARPLDAVPLIEQLVVRVESEDGAARLSGVLADRLVRAVGECWARGWQPADLVHVVGRRLRAPHRQLCADVVTLDARTYRHASDADPAWLAQLDAVAEHGSPSPDRALLLGREGGSVDDRREAVTTALETLAELYGLPAQPRLCPPPSEWGRGPRHGSGADAGSGPGQASGRGSTSGSGPGSGPGSGSAGSSGPGSGSPSARRPASGAPDPKITEKVRALLAKAESTEFPEEAEAFTAKAQELIARHAIDLAMLEGSPGEGGPRAHGRRILIDDPYGKAKALLLGAIASANRCRTVRSQALGICTVFGAPDDLDAVELLYTSLLTQATAAMVVAGRAGPRSRSRSYRHSFLVAYADRIGERLRAATSSAVDDARARHGDNVLPVLASREVAADTACEEAFPQLRTERISTSNVDGWIAGRAAAELAHLGPTTALRAG